MKTSPCLPTSSINAPDERKSNIELLRIIAMVMIAAHHFVEHGGFAYAADAVTLNRLWTQFLSVGGKIGVNVFVLISGYFLVSAPSFRTNRFIRLWGQIFTYSILSFAVFVLSGAHPFSLKELATRCLPVTFSLWWFASAYCVLYLLSPFFNRLLTSFDKRTYQRFLLLLTVCWCLIPTFTGQQLESNDLLWFLYLYALAGYLRLHGLHVQAKGSVCLLLATGAILLTFLSAAIFDVLGIKYPVFGEHATFFYRIRTLPVLLASVLLLVGFLRIDIGHSRFVNTLASATFGVYLLHDDGFVRTFLWEKLFCNAAYADSALLIPYSLLAIAAVYCGCTIVELIRRHTLERLFSAPVEALARWIDRTKERVLSSRLLQRL